MVYVSWLLRVYDINQNLTLDIRNVSMQEKANSKKATDLPIVKEGVDSKMLR